MQAFGTIPIIQGALDNLPYYDFLPYNVMRIV